MRRNYGLHWIVGLALAACGTSVGSAQAAQPAYAAKHPHTAAMLLAVAQAQAQIMLAGLRQDYASALPEARKAEAVLDDNIVAAVKEAHGKADLSKAVKEFYTAAKTYLDDIVPSDRLEQAAMARRKSEFDAKESALHLELDLDK